jgi:hypothetical protein
MRTKRREPQVELFTQRMAELAGDKQARDCLVVQDKDIATARGVLGFEVLNLNQDGHGALLECSGNFGLGHFQYLSRVLQEYHDKGDEVGVRQGGGCRA